MSLRQAPKKSETLEVRLPFATKAAFMSRCRQDGRTASEAVRGFIEQDLQSSRPRLRWRQVSAAALAGLALGAVAAPSLAHPAASSRAAFDRLDRNHDGVVSFEEFRAG